MFGRGEAPAPIVQAPGLGELRWSEEYEAWLGTHRGHAFSLAHEGRAQPSERVCAYARRVLDDPALLESSLAQARAEAQHRHPAVYTGEIEALTLGMIHFYIHHRGGERIIADLDGGKDYRAWRIEYSGMRCEGIGFDR